jgi:regulatory protein
MSFIKNIKFMADVKNSDIESVRIENIKISRFDKSILNVYLENGLFFTLHDEVCYALGVRSGHVLGKDELHKLMEANEARMCSYYAMVQSFKKRRTVAEMRRKLISMGFSQEKSDDAVSMLLDGGYLGDDAFADDYIDIKKGSSGKQKIAHDLMKKGIPKDVIREKLSVVTDEDQERLASLAGEKKLRSMDDGDPKKREKLMAFLLRRGYSYETVKSVVRTLIQ